MSQKTDPRWQELIPESQRACLRRVGQGMSSKEIALQMGLSPRTVDEYVGRAGRILGATNRREAARILASLEDCVPQKIQLEPQAVAKDPISAEPESVGRSGEPSGWLSRLPRWLPGIGGERHDLRPTEVTRDIVAVSLFTMAVATAIMTVVFWLNKYLH